jgi:membrane-bound lytic murein transglycosylase D
MIGARFAGVERLGVGDGFDQRDCGFGAQVKAKLVLMCCILSVITGCSTISSHQNSSSGKMGALRNKAGNPAEEGLFSPDHKGGGQYKSVLAVPDHPSIDAWTITYTERKHQSFQTLLRRAEDYVLPVQKIFADAGVPKDLVYVALVESGFTTTARSSADAVGMWQFIASTGERFGLEQNKWVDERRHPFKSAEAAAAYLSTLYDQFGSWPLALAAYNCGENRVQRVLDESGLTTFWELRDAGWLPAETEEYVPKVYAAIRISRDLNRYGFYFMPKQDPPAHETVSVPGGVKLAWLGQKIGVHESILQEHNPELCRTVTPPGAPSYILCVPPGTKESVLAALTEPRPSEVELARSSSREQRSSRTAVGSSKGKKSNIPNGKCTSKSKSSAAPSASLQQDRRAAPKLARAPQPAADSKAPKATAAAKPPKDVKPLRNTAVVGTVASIAKKR